MHKYRNKETEIVDDHIGRDGQPFSEKAWDRAFSVFGRPGIGNLIEKQFLLADELEDLVIETADGHLSEPSLEAELLLAAIERVDFYFLAGTMLKAIINEKSGD